MSLNPSIIETLRACEILGGSQEENSKNKMGQKKVGLLAQAPLAIRGGGAPKDLYVRPQARMYVGPL